MPFNTHHNIRRRRFRRRRRKPRLTVKSLARKVRHLEIEQKPERKFIDAFTGPFGIDLNTASIATQVVNIIPQGTTEADRIGDKVELTSLQLDYWIQARPSEPVNASGNPVCTLVRFLVVWFPGVGEADPTDIDIRNVLEANNALSFYKRNGKVNYKVLHDKTYEVELATMGNAAAAADPVVLFAAPLANSSHKHRVTIPIGKKSTYADAAGSVVKGTLCWYAFSTLNIAGGDYAELSVSSRLTYEDP